MLTLVHVGYVDGRTLCNERIEPDMQIISGFEAYPGREDCPQIPAREATPTEQRCPRCAVVFGPNGHVYKPRFVRAVMPLWRALESQEIDRAEFDQKYDRLIDDIVSEASG